MKLCNVGFVIRVSTAAGTDFARVRDIPLVLELDIPLFIELDCILIVHLSDLVSLFLYDWAFCVYLGRKVEKRIEGTKIL